MQQQAAQQQRTQQNEGSSASTLTANFMNDKLRELQSVGAQEEPIDTCWYNLKLA